MLRWIIVCRVRLFYQLMYSKVLCASWSYSFLQFLDVCLICALFSIHAADVNKGCLFRAAVLLWLIWGDWHWMTRHCYWLTRQCLHHYCGEFSCIICISLFREPCMRSANGLHAGKLDSLTYVIFKWYLFDILLRTSKVVASACVRVGSHRHYLGTWGHRIHHIDVVLGRLID
jgi:hypothetical protein